MPKFVLTIETETEEAARVLAKWIDEDILIPAGYWMQLLILLIL